MTIPYDPSRAALYFPESRDTMFQSQQRYSPLQLAVEAARLAYYRAEESGAQMQRLCDALARVDFAIPTLLIDVATGAAGFASSCKTNGAALIAFRGTQPDDIADIGHDLEAEMIPWPETAGRVHAGFALTTRALLPKMRAWIDETKPDPAKLTITGHSLGAAMATLAASVIKPGWLVTLGSPRVGDVDFIETVQAGNISRIVDCCDLVTRVPPPVGGYTHLPTCAYLTRQTQQLLDPAESVIEADCITARAEYLAAYAWKIGAVLVRDLADHAPINYVRAFFP